MALLYTNGLMGYCIAYIITEGATLVLSYIFILIYQKVKKSGTKGIFMIDDTEFETYDVSIDNELANSSLISENVTKFALDNGVPNYESQIVGLASEELVANIVTYGYKKGSRNYIDVNLKINKDTLILRIRDDGVPFDPTKYEFDEGGDYSTSGIKLIENLSDKMSYMRILNLNNTTFEIKIKGA